MTVTYLIIIDVPDLSFTEDVGLEIEDTLTDNGFDVISVTAPPPPAPPEPLPPPLF